MLRWLRWSSLPSASIELTRRGLARGWRVLLTALRLAVIAGLLVIAFNPQERIRQMAFRPSRVAILADVSLSMRFPEKAATASTAPEAQRNREEAVRALLADSPLLGDLQKHHNVRVYTFDTELATPPAEVFPAQAERTASGPDLKTSPARGRTDKGPSTGGSTASKSSIDWNEILRPRGLETRLGESVIQAVQQLGGRTLSGIVVLSDGDSNAGIEPSTAQDVAKAAGRRACSQSEWGVRSPP